MSANVSDVLNIEELTLYRDTCHTDIHYLHTGEDRLEEESILSNVSDILEDLRNEDLRVAPKIVRQNAHYDLDTYLKTAFR